MMLVPQMRPPCAGSAQFHRAVPEDRFARSRRNCIATPALIGRVAALRIKSFPASPFRIWREGRRGKMAMGFQAQAMRALPQERKRAAKGEMGKWRGSATHVGSLSGSLMMRASVANARAAILLPRECSLYFCCGQGCESRVFAVRSRRRTALQCEE